MSLSKLQELVTDREVWCAACSPWGRKVRHNWVIEMNWTELRGYNNSYLWNLHAYWFYLSYSKSTCQHPFMIKKKKNSPESGHGGNKHAVYSVAQSCLTLHNPQDDSPPGFSVHGIFQARVLGWVAISYSRGSSWPRNRTCVSFISTLAGEFFTTVPPGKPIERIYLEAIKATYIKPTANIKIKCKNLKAFPLRSETRQGCLLSPLLLNMVLEDLASVTRKRNNRNPN